MIVHLSPRQWHLKQVTLGVLLLVLALWADSESGAFRERQFLFYGLVGGLTVIYFIIFCRKVGERSRLLLTRRGIRFDDPRHDRGWIEWSHVAQARYSWLFQRFYIIGTDGRQLFSAQWKQLGSPASARRCARAVNEQLRRYRADQSNR